MENKKTTYSEILNAKEKVIITVKGISMLPMLRQRRDIVIIENKPYKMHDVVLFKRLGKNDQESYVLHRIVKQYDDGSYLILGDNNYTGDVVRPESIMGVLTSFVRDGKEIKVTDYKYKMYVCFYCAPYRLRVAIKKSFAARCFRAIKKRLK